MRMGVIDTWGSSVDERARSYPCDEVLERTDKALFRAVTVGAPSDLVFAWLCQLRVAPYSYDWIDNWGRRSPRRLDPALLNLEVGQQFAGIFRLVTMEPGRSLTLCSGTPLFGHVGITYAADPLEAGSSRLLAKIVMATRPGVWGRLMHVALPAGDLFMMRKQLLTLKSLAERDARSTVRSSSTL